MLSELDDLIKEVQPQLRATIPRAPISLGNDSLGFPSDYRRPAPWRSQDKIYCPVCATDRFVKVNILLHTGPLTRLSRGRAIPNQYVDLSTLGPSLVLLTCVQCFSDLNCIVYDELSGDIKQTKVIVLPTKCGGIGTLHTPPEVKHFVDEAYKCQSFGAYGAAVEMYRVALEQLLDNQGYTTGSLSKKIDLLEIDQKSSKAKPWIADLDIEMLHILRKLGNNVAHIKSIKSLEAFDADAIIGVQEVFQYLLFEIYERPFNQNQIRNILMKTDEDKDGETSGVR